MNKTFTVLDLETTGLYFEAWDEPIEICAIKTDGETVLEEFHEYIKPYKTVPKKVVQITRITNESLADKESKYEVLPRLRKFIGDSIVIAHNATFDINMLNFWFVMLNLPLITEHICTMKAFRACTGQKKANLAAATEYFSIKLDNAHSALYDTRATVELFHKMNKEFDLSPIVVTEGDAFVAVMKRYAAANSNIAVKSVLCDDYLEPKPDDVYMYPEEGMFKEFDNFTNPKNLYIKCANNYEDILAAFSKWMNHINISKHYSLVNDTKVRKFVALMLRYADSIEDLISMHKAIFGTVSCNLLVYITHYYLANDKKMVYRDTDFGYFFDRHTSIPDLSKKINRDEFFVADFFVNWAIENKREESHRDFIKEHLVGRAELRAIVKDGKAVESVKEYITLGLYKKDFFDLKNN